MRRWGRWSGRGEGGEREGRGRGEGEGVGEYHTIPLLLVDVAFECHGIRGAVLLVVVC